MAALCSEDAHATVNALLLFCLVFILIYLAVIGIAELLEVVNPIIIAVLAGLIIVMILLAINWRAVCARLWDEQASTATFGNTGGDCRRDGGKDTERCEPRMEARMRS